MLLKGVGARFGGARHDRRRRGRRPRADRARASASIPGSTTAPACRAIDRTSPRRGRHAATRLADEPAFVELAGGRRRDRHARVRDAAGPSAQGRCRGKTGTLHDVANLVGYCTARDGHTLAFAFLMNGLSTPTAGHSIEDRMAVAVAKYNG